MTSVLRPIASLNIAANEMITSMVEYDMRIFVITTQRVFLLDDGKLVQVPFMKAD
jgi:uncharacterized membrane protein (DUF441 family)